MQVRIQRPLRLQWWHTPHLCWAGAGGWGMVVCVVLVGGSLWVACGWGGGKAPFSHGLEKGGVLTTSQHIYFASVVPCWASPLWVWVDVVV